MKVNAQAVENAPRFSLPLFLWTTYHEGFHLFFQENNPIKPWPKWATFPQPREEIERSCYEPSAPNGAYLEGELSNLKMAFRAALEGASDLSQASIGQAQHYNNERHENLQGRRIQNSISRQQAEALVEVLEGIPEFVGSMAAVRLGGASVTDLPEMWTLQSSGSSIYYGIGALHVWLKKLSLPSALFSKIKDSLLNAAPYSNPFRAYSP